MAIVLLHDTRLHGVPEEGIGTVVTVDASVPLADGLNRACAAAMASDDELAIACHGYMGHAYRDSSNVEKAGGQGLELCQESMVISNISHAAILSGYFSRIWLMACGPAGTAVDDTRPFCREFALHANTSLIASDTAQIYHPGTYDTAQRVSRQVLRFGNWEGNVYEFLPTGEVRPFTSGETPMP